MRDKDVIEILQACYPIYINLHDKVGHTLSEEELALLGKFKALWEDGLFCNPELIEKAGMGQYELAFLGGYIYYYDQLVAS